MSEREALFSFSFYADQQVLNAIATYRAIERKRLTAFDKARFGALLAEAHQRRLTT